MTNSPTVSTEIPSTEDMITNELIEDAVSVNLVLEIETVIGSMALDQKVMVGHSEEAYFWKFQYGSVEVFVQLTGFDDEDTLTVWSVVLPLPAKNEQDLFRKILEMNWSATFEARFGILEDNIIVVSSRTIADLSPQEISRIITIVATIADENDDAWQAEYGMNNG
ncbi:YbjN domain-containing protein [Ancylothrix sp. C2]|uniref:YbjN domain-containing protein n=1 Tax=Ancylothrix sp. D3o TaxID=2953691 RepID=UPI0021BA9BCD|nr:YbjN domain-containing protein [Ancylothrix sp. D3o]MCT7950195.1 YbjN domain-containing protein [Ancylothrix sp. D3o]